MSALIAVLIQATVAFAAPATPGPYAGTTDQLCPQFAIEKELCGERERLPISLEATATRIESIKATVVENCEDGLPSRLVEVELQHSYRLKREGSDRASFNVKLGAHPLPGNEAEGFVRRQEARGELAALQKDPEDPAREAYCYAGISWQVFPRKGPGPALPTLPELGESEAPGAPSSPPPVQQCLARALARPRVVRALKMTHSGIWPDTGHPYEQAVGGQFAYEAVPAACSERYERSARGELEMLRDGHWIRTYYGTTGWVGLDAGKAPVHTGGGHPDAPGRAPEYNSCVGGRFHRVRITILTSLTRPALNKIEGRRRWRFPVAVHGSCAAASRSEQRVHMLQEELFGSVF
jgi:hypothetical protein